MNAKQAFQIIASLAQAMNAINPNPDLVQKMIGKPRFLQDRLRMLLENPVPEAKVPDDKSWKLTRITQDVPVVTSRIGWDVEKEVVRFHGRSGDWDESKLPKLKDGVAHGYVSNKRFESTQELLRAALRTESDGSLHHIIEQRGLAWDISQITPFLSDYVWEGNNPLNLRTDGGRNFFLIVDPKGHFAITRVEHERREGKSKWYGMYPYDFRSDCIPYKDDHIYFRNDPADDSNRTSGQSRH